MMGSGKTTIGRLLSEALDYSFLDWFVPEQNYGLFLNVIGIS